MNEGSLIREIAGHASRTTSYVQNMQSVYITQAVVNGLNILLMIIFIEYIIRPH